MEYLICSTDVYRVSTIEDVKSLHERLKADPHFELIAFSYKTKTVKSKGEIIDEYQLVSAKKAFNIEKEPDAMIKINYEVE